MIVPTYTISVEKDAVGHTAIATDANGHVIARASGFGSKDARRKLRAVLSGDKYVPTVVKRPKSKKGGKLHNPAGVILTAKSRIEEFMPRNAKFKKKQK